MTESEFQNISEQLFAYIQEQIETQSDAFDCVNDGNVLSAEHENGITIIINRHLPTQELWIASPSGGFHFSEHNGNWFSSRENADFFTVLNKILQEVSGESLVVKSVNFQA